MLRDFTAEFFDTYYNTLTSEALDEAYLDSVERWQDELGPLVDPDYPQRALMWRTLQRWFDADEFTREEIRRIQDDVYRIEDNYSARADGTLRAMQSLSRMLAAHRDCFTEGEGGVGIDTGKLSDALGDEAAALRAAYDEVIRQYMDKYMNGDEYDWDAIEKALQGSLGDLSPYDLAALTLLFLGMDDEKDVEKFINLGYQQSGTMGSDYTTTYSSVMSDVLRMIAALAFASISEEVAAKDGEGQLSDEERAALGKRLSRALLLCTLASQFAVNSSKGEFYVDLTGFDSSGKFTVYGHTPFEASIEGRIPNVSVFLGEGSGEQSAWDELAAIYAENNKWAQDALGGFLFDIVMSILTNGISDKTQFVVDVLVNAAAALEAAIQSEREKAEKGEKTDIASLRFAVSALGGRLYYAVVGSSVVVLGYSFDTIEAVIKLSGLQYHLGISPEEAIRILRAGDTEDNPAYWMVYNYVKDVGKPTYVDYRKNLSIYFEAHFSAFWELYGDKYPWLTKDTPADQLPMEVLCLVVARMSGGQ